MATRRDREDQAEFHASVKEPLLSPALREYFARPYSPMPDSEVGKAIRKLIDKNPSMTPEEAYLKSSFNPGPYSGNGR